MIKPGLKIGIVLSIILVLPSLFFSTYEIGNLSQNEAVIDSVYSSQMESILFSINQYADDVMSAWAHQLDRGGLEIEQVLEKNYSIDALAVIDSSQFLLYPKEKIGKDSIQTLKNYLKRSSLKNATKIKTLQRYLNTGYQKIEAINSDFKGKSLFVFARKLDSTSWQTVFIFLNTDKFILENFGPKIQIIAQNRFFISVFNADREVFSNVRHDEPEKNIRQKKDIWLFPGYQLGIQMKGNTIEDLVRKRTRTNIILLIVMDIILLLGAWFVYKSIRQQLRLTQLKSDFISNVSHEIRTPLALINMYSETLEMGRINSEAKKHEYYKVINTEANRLSRMVNKILNFNRIESGRREYHFVITNLNEEVEVILENYKQHLDQNGFEIVFSVKDSIPDILMDREAFSEAIINLMDNAMKYSAKLKRIEIVTESNAAYTCVKVRDFGIGIAAKEQHLIYDKFFRVSTGDLAHKVKGSGIGLSIVKHIMDAHQGKIDLHSESGKGSCFSLCFPNRKK
ncbi:sensor histidine kinase [Ancylomarina longa]|uniref:histidine kinase n=1 Tax=Ancylomarina longa TaxID=2487017 RepID=A0A434AX81_9BACT|nr:HAMP domain-containing sensor histidine kinase [Ancylomarina longa]RUT79145.1 sensor histidine kinase [Ancylomarina longa]